MLKWMGRDITRLKKNVQMIDDIPVMGVKDLLECKKRMGRKKDLADIKKLERMLKRAKQ